MEELQVRKRDSTTKVANLLSKFCKSLMVCRTNNPGTGIQILQAAHPCLDKSFDHLQMDLM